MVDGRLRGLEGSLYWPYSALHGILKREVLALRAPPGTTGSHKTPHSNYKEKEMKGSNVLKDEKGYYIVTDRSTDGHEFRVYLTYLNKK